MIKTDGRSLTTSDILFLQYATWVKVPGVLLFGWIPATWNLQKNISHEALRREVPYIIINNMCFLEWWYDRKNLQCMTRFWKDSLGEETHHVNRVDSVCYDHSTKKSAEKFGGKTRKQLIELFVPALSNQTIVQRNAEDFRYLADVLRKTIKQTLVREKLSIW